jgi:hypothetical protein
MLDQDLAELYGVETKRLLEQVRRNSARLPGDFMFRLKPGRVDNLRWQNATSKSRSCGRSSRCATSGMTKQRSRESSTSRSAVRRSTC